MRDLIAKLFAVVLSASLLSFGVLAPAAADEEQPAEAQEVAQSDEQSAEQEANQTVTVGVFAFDGYHNRDDEGRLSGYGIELLELLERYSRLNFKMVGYDCSWSDMLEMLEKGEIDMVTSARQTSDRAKQFAFSLPVGTNRTVLSVAADNTKIVANDFATYNGMRVGVLAGSSQNELITAYAKEKGFTCEIIEFKDSDRLSRALQAGRVDAVLTSSLRRAANERVIDTLAVDDFYAIVRKDDTELLNEINYAIEQMDLHEGDWKNVLYYRFYGPENTAPLEFTPREQEYIEQVKAGQKRITVTAVTDRRPYSYVDDGQLKGIMLDYFAAIMAVTGMPYEIVVPQNSDDYLTLAEMNGVDVVLDAVSGEAETTIGEAGHHGFATQPYLRSSFAIVTRTNFEGSPSVVAVGDGQTAELVRQHLPEEIEVVRYTTPEGAMQAVADGEADAAYAYAYAAQLFVNQDKSDGLHYSIANDLSTEFSMYVRDSADHELVTLLDKCIQMVPQSKVDQLVMEYTARNDDPSFEEFVRANPVMAAVAGIGFLLIILVVLGLVLRDRWSQKLIHAKEESYRDLGEQLAIVDALSRDYTNVFAVDIDHGTAEIVKLEGYVTAGLDKEADITYSYTTILGNYINDRVHPEDKRKLADELSLETVRQKLSDSDEYLGTYRIIDEDGEVHHYQFVYTFVDDRDGVTFILAGFRNIDETIRNEQEQRALLSEALAKAQYASRSKTAFLNNMSHDIRTPMNAIIGFTSLASEHLDEPEQIQDYLNKITTSSSHLLSLINDVLDMSRIESGKVKIEEQETNLQDILRDLKTIVQPDIKEKNLRFSIGLVGVQNATVVCDKLRLNQVLLNILNNAMKYTKAGGRVSVVVMQTSEVEDGRADYEFRVKDTGIGMAPEFLEHVFEPFERESTATVSGIQGTGLGLAITKNIVDIMGGDISVTSEQGVGSEFTVKVNFPVVEAAEPARKDDGHKSSWPSAAEGKSPDEVRFDGKRILLVEDNELNLEIAQAILERVGFTVDTADDGTVAVEKMDEMPPGTYDLVLTDVQMPHMDGYEETRTIRLMDDLRKATVPIVAMTANAFEEDREKAASAGMNGYVCKPINVKELMRVLGDILR